MKKTKDYHEITGVIRCVSGFRIGGSDELLQIGGADNTCIKHPVSFQPYLPGTSLKGKMRSELEQILDKIGDQGKPCGCAQLNCLVCRIFGPHAQTRHELGPTRIIVRDGQLLSGGTIEVTSSTAINRNTGAGLDRSLRPQERVAAGSTFDLRIGVQVWDIDAGMKHKNLQNVEKTGDMALVAFVLDGLKLVERTGLGSGVSKGSGEIRFEDLKLNGKPIPEDLW